MVLNMYPLERSASGSILIKWPDQLGCPPQWAHFCRFCDSSLPFYGLCLWENDERCGKIKTGLHMSMIIGISWYKCYHVHQTFHFITYHAYRRISSYFDTKYITVLQIEQREIILFNFKFFSIFFFNLNLHNITLMYLKTHL